ncbi:multiheme c-type cytochrome [Albidovulum sp.]|uniref:multiheme c-type cytochrome n=1 Tax=Albidovulum sp. TaxID=1872424 RepID=UPI00305FCE7F
MTLKTQLRYHAKPLTAFGLAALVGLALWATLAPPVAPVGVALSAIPFYRLPFGPDADGADRPFWPSRLQSATGLFSDPARLPSSAECATCHRQEFQEWAASLHAIADRDLVYEATVEANEAVVRNPEQTRFCEGCHAPNEMLTGRVTRFTAVPPAEALTEGVACITCHTATHADPVAGNGAVTLAYGRAEAERDGPQGAALLADPRAHLAAFGAPDTTALMKSADLCGTCHVEIYDRSMSKAETPQAVQSTFTEWRDSWYGQNNVTCQDCHMAADPAAQVMALRQSTPVKPDRYSHRFIGANHVMADTGLGDALSVLRGGLLPGMDAAATQATLDEQARQTAAFLRTAAALELRDLRQGAGGLRLDIAVRNLGAGHNLPTGVNDQKHMWLEVEVTDAGGNTVFRSGGAAERLGVEDPEAVTWIEHFVDPHGKRLTDHLTFSTAEVVWVRKPIPARGEDVVGYDLPLAAGAPGPLHLRARLLYRVALPDLVFTNLRRDIAIPPFTLAELSADLPEATQ